MTTQPPPRRDPWRLVWRLATNDVSLALVSLGLSAYLLVLAVVPQIPDDPMLTDRWLAQAQGRFGAAAEPLYRLGVFSLADSPISGLLLAAIAFFLLIRTAERVEQLWRSRGASRELQTPTTKLPEVLPVLIRVGVLLVLLGMLVNHLWGWQEQGILRHVEDRLDLAGRGEIVFEERSSGIRTRRPEITVHVIGNGPELAVRAFDEESIPLDLQQGPREITTTELVITLTPDAPEAFFAVPDANLVIRAAIVSQSDFSTETAIDLQVFRTPIGELVEEIELTGTDQQLELDGIRLQVSRSTYLVLKLIFNPGRWLELVGLLLGAVSLLASLALPIQPERWQRAAWFFRAAICLLTLAVSGMALYNLIATGTPGGSGTVQTGLTAVWLATTATGLILFRPGRLRSGGEN